MLKLPLLLVGAGWFNPKNEGPLMTGSLMTGSFSTARRVSRGAACGSGFAAVAAGADCGVGGRTAVAVDAACVAAGRAAVAVAVVADVFGAGIGLTGGGIVLPGAAIAAPGPCSSDAPHMPQKRCVSGFSFPQWGQRTTPPQPLLRTL